MVAAGLIILGRIATLAGREGFGWVEAIAIEEGRIVATGTRSEVEVLAGAGTRWLRLRDEEVAIPGMTDAHLHLIDAALAREELDLSDASSLEEALERVGRRHLDRLAAGDREGWLLGRGWSLDRWGSWPTARPLEQVAPGRPVCLWSVDHHARWLSPAALAGTDITASTSDPPGGFILRDRDGSPSGVLLEAAVRLVDPAIPGREEPVVARAIVAYAAELAALGIVGCHDPGETVPDPELRRGPLLYGRLAAAGRLPLRVRASIRLDQLERAMELGLRSGDALAGEKDGSVTQADRARVGWLKLFADGTLGSRTAALLEPYETPLGSPAPPAGATGALSLSRAALEEATRRAARADIATQIHAIGDRAVRVALDVLEASDSGRFRLRPRVEHAQLVDPADLARFSAAGVAASVQPIHLRTDAAAAREAWGARAAHSYPWRALDEQGGLLPLGTDAPVEPADPWPGISLAVTRRDPSWGPDAPAFHPEQGISLPRALRAACLDPVETSGEGSHGGRLIGGRRADLQVIPAAALREPVAAGGPLGTARPVLTLIDGVEVYRHPSFDR